MSRRTAECYESVFEYIERNVFELAPAEFITDFESGMRSAINKFYPEATLRGCWFHYSGAIRKKCQKLKIRTKTKQAKLIKWQLMSLPLLPSAQIQTGYSSIKQIAKKKRLFKLFAPLFKYFESYWLAQVRIERRLEM